MTRKLIACILIAGAWPPAGIAAGDSGTSMFSFGGFGTMGVVHSDNSQADFTSSSFQAVGAGHTHSWSPAVDSRIAGQVTANFTPRLSAVLQVIAEQNYDNTYRPHVEWANIKYQFTPDFSVRIGRTGEPLFMATDSRKIGYANPWVRPPVELYGLVPVTTNDGFDASYRLSIGAAANTLQAVLGRANYKYPIPGTGSIGTAEARQGVILVDSVQHGFATLRAMYGRAHITVPYLHPYFDLFRQFGPQGAAIADRYDLNSHRINFYALGASYEPGDWFATAEWAHVETQSILGDKTGWYVSGGYRINKVTPFVTYGQVKVDSNTSDPGLSVSGLPPPVAAVAEYLNAGLNGALASLAAQKSFSIGARWDFMQSVDLKLQYDRITPGAPSPGTLTNLQPGFTPGGHVNLLSATIDFVF